MIAAACAVYFAVKTSKANSENAALTTRLEQTVSQDKEQMDSLTAQLEAAEKRIAELQPLADKARTLPLTWRIDRHALHAGYDLFVFSRARESLRFHFTINGTRKVDALIDGGKLWILHGLASGDSVEISSDGYDSKTVPIQ